MMIALLLLLLAMWRWYDKRSNSKVPTSGKCRRCSCWTSSEFILATINIIITVLLGVILYIIALMLADLCTSNVNVNANRVLAEYLHFPPFETYYGNNATEMCQLVANDVTGEVPIEFHFLCYYQTCDPNLPFPLLELDLVSYLYQVALQDNTTIYSLVEAIESNTTSDDTSCLDPLRAIPVTLDVVLANLGLILTFISCRYINPIYAATMYNDVCNIQVHYAIGMFGSWITGAILLLIILALWFLARHDIKAQPMVMNGKRLPVTGPQTGELTSTKSPQIIPNGLSQQPIDVEKQL